MLFRSGVVYLCFDRVDGVGELSEAGPPLQQDRLVLLQNAVYLTAALRLEVLKCLSLTGRGTKSKDSILDSSEVEYCTTTQNTA